MHRRELFFCVTLIAASMTPGVSQTLPVAPAGSAAQSGAFTPDFSGIWSHPFLTGFEPPASGPGPVKNRSRRRDGVANFQQLVGDFANPILKPEAQNSVTGATFPS